MPELSLVVEGTEVTLVSGGATVVFRDPGIAGTSFSTEVGSVRSSEPGRVEIALNPGRFSFDLNTGTSGD